MRLGLVTANPVTGIPKLREAGGRVVYLMADDEAALRDALPPALRPMMTVAINTAYGGGSRRGFSGVMWTC